MLPVEVAVIPTVLGGGVPMIAEPAPRIKLELQAQDVYKETGTIGLVSCHMSYVA